MASYTSDGPQLYTVEPSGLSHRFFAAAIGELDARPLGNGLGVTL